VNAGQGILAELEDSTHGVDVAALNQGLQPIGEVGLRMGVGVRQQPPAACGPIIKETGGIVSKRLGQPIEQDGEHPVVATGNDQ
jgi:hypothetical protein